MGFWTYIFFTGLILLIAAFSFAAGRIYASNRMHDEKEREYERGRKAGYREGRKVLELGRRTPPVAIGHTSNRAKRAGH